MADNKEIRDEKDRVRIDVNNRSEVEYVHRLFTNLSHQQIIDSIQKYGPMRDDVIKFLSTQSSVGNLED